MKILVLVSEKRKPDNTALYEILTKKHDLHIIRLDRKKQKWLRWHLRNTDFSSYDAVISDLHFKNIYKQWRFFKRLDNLYFLEEDACQNFLEESKWHQTFSSFYLHLPKANVFASGYLTNKKLCNEGIKSHFIPKAYDHTVIKNNNNERDIKFGFIGNIENSVYRRRKETLLSIREILDLRIIKTKPGKDYVIMLNRIEYFISADTGLDEYMIKNFEAMAAGCILCAWKQGGGEESALGLEDMKNCILYSNRIELLEKINTVNNNKLKKNIILKNSKKHVINNFSYHAQGKNISKVLNSI